MPERSDPILLYHPDGYRVARQDLKGRHSAGESFLTAFLEHSQGRDIHALCANKAIGEDFQNAVQAGPGSCSPRVVGRNDIQAIRRQGLLHLPAPGIAEEARIRDFFGGDAYAISGVTHTISSREMLDGVADIAVAPVQQWDALICTSNSVHKALSGVLSQVEDDLRLRLGASRFTRPLMPVIPLGVHANRFTRNEFDRAKWRTKLGLAEDTVAILFFGRLSVHAKASPFQLAQASELAATRVKKPLAIIWCGWFNDDFQRRVFMNTAKSMSPNVAFHHVDGRDAETRFSIWSAADIFCSLSDNIQESFGLTVIEAMAAELPIVVSNWDGYREAVEHGRNGVLIDTHLPQTSLANSAYRYASGVDTYDLYIGAISQLCFGDLEQTADWLARLAGDATLRRGLATAARRTVESQFDWKVVMPRYFELWQEQHAMLTRGRAGKTAIPSSGWKTLDPSNTFAGFPSRHLSPETMLTAGPTYSRWSDLASQPGIVVNASVLTGRTQFQALQKQFSDGQSHHIDRILAEYSEADRDAVMRTLHWAIKVGLLALVAAQSSTPTAAKAVSD